MSASSSPQRAIVTGASSGIGRATAIAFAQAGIDVALVSRSADKLQTVAAEIQALGGQAKAYPIDLANLPAIRQAITAVVADFQPIDILVNNAGMGYTGFLSDTPLQDWQQVLDLNLTSALECTLGVLFHMRDRHKGIIINVASIAAKTPFPGWGAYSVSKAGLVAFSKTLAAEERANGIRVVAFCPGAVNTPIWDTDTVQADFNRAAMLTPEIVAQSILHTVLLPEQAVVEDITLMPSTGAL
ncbi:MAG: SDR family oxidoreductase [Spirulina sp. SIO3F2]|nr:SDR family oxidoreductase [Spirulina sp. SIO3F2]